MKKIRVAFFDTKPYDRKSFDAANEKFGFELTYFEARLNPPRPAWPPATTWSAPS